MMGLDLSGHELVPITGDLAPELEAYAVVPKKSNPRAAKLDAKIREHCADLVGRRPVQIGKYRIESTREAQKLITEEIPNNPNIPNRVKHAMILAIQEMLAPKKH